MFKAGYLDKRENINHVERGLKRMIDHTTPTPLYKQLKGKIITAIENGQLKPDERIPSERELCNTYNVSRITVRQAIAEAEKEGLVYKIHGKGTFVKQPKIEQGLVKLTSFSKTLLAKGLKGSTKMIASDIVPVNFQVANLLDINLSEQVVNIVLLGSANDEPMVYYDSYFTYDLGIEMIKAAEKNIKLDKAFSTYDLYQDINIMVDSVSQTFEAINCNKDIARLLKVPGGTALLLVTSIFYTRDKRPLEFKTAMYRADKYRFHITRSIV